jgi:UDP-N-acetylglucosamine acyltransferase
MIGPYCHVDPGAEIGEGTVLEGSVTLLGRTRTGRDCRIHPYAVLRDATLGDRTVVREHVSITGARLGDDVYVMANSVVGPGCELENHVIVVNACVLPGRNRIEEWAIVSAHVELSEGLTVGRHAFVGGASRITRPVPPYVLVQGFDGEVRGINSVGLRRRGFRPETMDALREACRRLWRLGEPVDAVERELGMVPEVRTLVEFLRR